MTITTVNISGQTFDVYGSVAELNGYVAGSILPAGVTFTSDFSRKQKLLVTSTRVFERTAWVGTPTDLTTPQPLAWPRTGIVDRNGTPVLDSVVPDDIFSGFFELCLALDQDADTALLTQATTGSNVRRNLERDKVGELETEREQEFFVSTATGKNAVSRFPLAVLEYICPFLASSVQATLGFASGTDRCSTFDAGGLLSDFGFTGSGLP